MILHYVVNTNVLILFFFYNHFRLKVYEQNYQVSTTTATDLRTTFVTGALIVTCVTGKNSANYTYTETQPGGLFFKNTEL